MSFARGLILILSFSFTWGLLSGINALILQAVVGMQRGLFTLAVSIALGLVEALVLLELADRAFFRSNVPFKGRRVSRQRGETTDHESQAEVPADK